MQFALFLIFMNSWAIKLASIVQERKVKSGFFKRGRGGKQREKRKWGDRREEEWGRHESGR